MTSPLHYRPRTGDIPTQPGVYRFFNNDRVLYVGKAKNLRNRLTSYFAPLDSLHERTRRMVTSANRVEWVIVPTEFEALQLEFTWIKEFDPPFNVQFKDDKSYPYLAFSMAEEVPRVFITRRRFGKGNVYFGPYSKAWVLRETLDTLLKPFPVRSCSSSTFETAKRTNRPCLLGDIGKCAAPCVGRVTPQAHRAIADNFISFMAGKNDDIVDILRQRMLAASANLDFELAARLRDSVDALEQVVAKSIVVLSGDVDADVFAIARDELSVAVSQFVIRSSRISGARDWTVDADPAVSDAELVEDLLREAYREDAVPRLVVVPALPADAEALQRWLSENAGSGSRTDRSAVELRVAKRGDLARVAETVAENAEHALKLYKAKRSSDYVSRSQALSDLASVLGLDEAPLRIECFDVSHLSGSNVVGAMVVFEDGLAKKSDYRSFNLPDVNDDVGGMSALLERRIRYLNPESEGSDDEHNTSTRTSFSYAPGLFVVDGGQPQVNAASKVLRAGNIDIPVVGIAKKLEELWLPGSDFPVILPRASEAMFLIQRIRDEAHRFSITKQRKRRSKDIVTALNGIPGLGPRRVSSLLKHFGSVVQLQAATADDMMAVQGIGDQLATDIYAAMHPEQN